MKVTVADVETMKGLTKELVDDIIDKYKSGISITLISRYNKVSVDEANAIIDAYLPAFS
jgi:hypothetical protein